MDRKDSGRTYFHLVLPASGELQMFISVHAALPLSKRVEGVVT